MKIDRCFVGPNFIILMASLPAWAQGRGGLEYPPAPRAEVVEDYHGTKVPDPFRPLEDDNAPATKTWVEAENKVTFAYLEKIAARKPLKDRLTRLWDYEKYTTPRKDRGLYFYSYNTGLQNQNVFYVADSLSDQGRVLIDPNTLSADGTVALGGTSVSDDGRYVAYAVADGGSDWQTWRVRDVATGRDLDDAVKWSKFSRASWTKDGQGFYYARFPEPQPGADLKGPNYFQKLYYHRLGTPQSADRLVFENPAEKTWMFQSTVTDDGRYLVITVRRSSAPKVKVFYQDLTATEMRPSELVGDFESKYDFIDNVGHWFYFETDRDAPRGRVIAIDVNRPAPEHWRTIVPEASATLQNASIVGDRILANYLQDASSRVRVFDLDGWHQRDVELPGLGTVAGLEGKRTDPETFYSYTSFTTPTTIYRYDVKSGKSTLHKAPKLAFRPDEYTTEQVFYTSKDGAKVPMFLSYKKGLVKDGKAPTLLFGYGGFDISLTPTFKVDNLAWMELGGVFAQPNLRGGGEYGEEWHRAGTKLRKQNVFDDFIAAAEWLIANKYTSTPKLAIEGRSNGGLLVGACMTQRPELFGAALPAVGVMDMLRFHKFTIGHAWTDDYGSADDPEQFAAIFKYSPLHSLRKGMCYPPTLVTTADHDDRVVPAHSFKFAATLQESQSCDNPVLIRIETRAGHGAGKPTAKSIEEAADRWAFLVKSLGIEYHPEG
jgi:prolyl oligopeptidase